jgi:hypothetical protein
MMQLMILSAVQIVNRELGQIPRTPHIHFWTVDRRTKQKLWWPVPKGNNAIRVIAAPTLLVKSSKTEIRKFKFTTVVDQDIGPLDVTMDDTFVVKISQPSQHLLAQ